MQRITNHLGINVGVVLLSTTAIQTVMACITFAHACSSADEENTLLALSLELHNRNRKKYVSKSFKLVNTILRQKVQITESLLLFCCRRHKIQPCNHNT